MDLKKTADQGLNVYVYGWKGLAEYFGIHKRTLQRWDEKLKIPWDKSGPKKNDSVRIHVWTADTYYKFFRSKK